MNPPQKLPAAMVTNAVILDRVDAVLVRVTSIEHNQADLSKTTADFQLEYTKAHAILDAKTTAAHTRIDAQEKDIEAQEKDISDLAKELKLLSVQVEQLRWSNKLQSWFYGIIGCALLIWLVGQFLGLIKP